MTYYLRKKILIQKFYTTNKTLIIIKQVKIIDKIEIVIAILDANKKTFFVYIAIWKEEKMVINLT